MSSSKTHEFVVGISDFEGIWRILGGDNHILIALAAGRVLSFVTPYPKRHIIFNFMHLFMTTAS